MVGTRPTEDYGDGTPSGEAGAGVASAGGGSQRAANQAVVKASEQGAEDAIGWYGDPESPNPYSLF